MTEKALEARREYKRAWSRANRARLKEAEERYWEKKAAAAAPEQGARELQEMAKEMRRAYKRAWSRANRERLREAEERYWERKAAAKEQ